MDGNRYPPTDFVKRLREFDPNLRVVWGLNQAAPFPGWVIERRIPGKMKAKFYENKPLGRERYAFQVVTENGRPMARRTFDMMPDWWPVYQVCDEKRRPIAELGEFVIDFLRRNYQRTLLGFPELSEKFHRQDIAEREASEAVKHDKFLDDTSRKVLECRNEVWPEYFAHGGQPERIREGTEVYGNRNDTGQCERTPGEGPEPGRVGQGGTEASNPGVVPDGMDLQRV